MSGLFLLASGNNHGGFAWQTAASSDSSVRPSICPVDLGRPPGMPVRLARLSARHSPSTRHGRQTDPTYGVVRPKMPNYLTSTSPAQEGGARFRRTASPRCVSSARFCRRCLMGVVHFRPGLYPQGLLALLTSDMFDGSHTLRLRIGGFWPSGPRCARCARLLSHTSARCRWRDSGDVGRAFIGAGCVWPGMRPKASLRGHRECCGNVQDCCV